jgi:hypothetical protein
VAQQNDALSPLYNQPLRDLPEAILGEANSTARRLNLALLALALLWCIYWFFHAWHYWEDDAYIHLEFARSVANGQGFAFNGRVVAGDTAPLWVLLIVGLHAFLVNWMIAGKVLTVLGAAFGFSGIYAFAARLARLLPGPLDASVFPAAMLVLVAATPYTCYWLFSGMEPIAAAGLACWAVLLATREQPTRFSFLAGCLLAGIGPLVRPELTFLTALLAVPLLGQWRRLAGAAKLSTLGLGALLFCGPVAAWLLYSLHAFGHLLPNTNAAKRASPGDSVVRHLLSVYAMGFPVVLAAVIGAVAYPVVRAGEVRRSISAAARAVWQPGTKSSGLPAAAWIVIAWTLITTLFYIVNHTYVQTRYILVTAPALVVVIVAAGLMLSRSGGRVLYAVVLAEALVISLLIARPFVHNKGIDTDATTQLATYMRDHLSPGAPVATYSIGQVAFLSQHPIIDTGGITRPEAIQFLNDTPEVQVRWAQTEGAQYFIGAKPQPNAVLVHQEAKQFASWTLHPSRYKQPDRVELWKLAPLN